MLTWSSGWARRSSPRSPRSGAATAAAHRPPPPPLPRLPAARARAARAAKGRPRHLRPRPRRRRRRRRARVAAEARVRDLSTWTILQNDGPSHLGLRCNALPAHQIALITSGGCVPSRRRGARRSTRGDPQPDERAEEELRGEAAPLNLLQPPFDLSRRFIRVRRGHVSGLAWERSMVSLRRLASTRVVPLGSFRCTCVCSRGSGCAHGRARREHKF